MPFIFNHSVVGFAPKFFRGYSYSIPSGLLMKTSKPEGLEFRLLHLADILIFNHSVVVGVYAHLPRNSLGAIHIQSLRDCGI
jgi:hypothetical protein